MSKITFTPRAWAAAGVVSAATLVNPAHAGLLSSTNPIITPNGTTTSFANPAVNADGRPFSTMLQVDQFDSSLGMLQAVELSFDAGTFSSELGALANLAACTGGAEDGTCSYAYGVTFNVEAGFTTPDGPMVARDGSGSSTGSDSVSNASRVAMTKLLGFFDSDFTNDVPASQPFALSPTNAGYVGTGTWDLVFDVTLSNVIVTSTCTASGESSCDGSDLGGSLTGQVNWGASQVQVTYTYMEVPEPGSFLLIGAGLGAVGLARRRRRRPIDG